MRHEDELKLQAYLDEELSGRKSQAVADWLAKDQDAQALLVELRNTSAALEGNEPLIPTPDSREFYWSKIQREIRRLETAPESGTLPFFVWLKRKYWVPVGALAILILLALGATQLFDWSGLPPYPHITRQVESPSEEMGSMTFRSEADRVTIVWLYDRIPEITTDTE